MSTTLGPLYRARKHKYLLAVVVFVLLLLFVVWRYTPSAYDERNGLDEFDVDILHQATTVSDAVDDDVNVNVNVEIEDALHETNTRSEQQHRTLDKGTMAYITLVTSDAYALYALVLFHRLRQLKTKHHLAILTSPGALSSRTLKLFSLLNISVHANAAPLDFLPAYAKATKHPTYLTDRDRNLWGKLRVWELEEYSKVVLIDSDVIVFSNIDELFTYPELSGCTMIDTREKISFYDSRNSTSLSSRLPKIPKSESLVGTYGLNSGVIVLKPSRATLERMYQTLRIIPQRPCCPTQEFLHRYFTHHNSFHILPDIYNARRWGYLSKEKQEELRGKIKIYHFVERGKPWSVRADTGFRSLWWKTFDEVKSVVEGLSGDAKRDFGMLVAEMSTSDSVGGNADTQMDDNGDGIK